MSVQYIDCFDNYTEANLNLSKGCKSFRVYSELYFDEHKKVLECKRIGIAVIGLEVPHAHIHLVPIKNVEDINFSRPKMSFTKEKMENTARLIREAI